jgi:hypothetical protein
MSDNKKNQSFTRRGFLKGAVIGTGASIMAISGMSASEADAALPA